MKKALVLLLLLIFSSTAISFAEELKAKKLKFKEYGPFYGIKENGIVVRGIHKGPKNEMAQTDYYGLFTKNSNYWKGYSKHTYNDGKVLYQYNEYKLDDKGNPIKDKDGIFQLVDSYLISADSFEKVKEYIHYDIELPFSFYDFEEPQTQFVKEESTQTQYNNEPTPLVCIPVSERTEEQLRVDKMFKHFKRISKLDLDCLLLKNQDLEAKTKENIAEKETTLTEIKTDENNLKNIDEIKKRIKEDGKPFSLILGDLETGEKNVTVSIKKGKTFPGLPETTVWRTEFSYLTKNYKEDGKIYGGNEETYTIVEHEDFPNFKIEKVKTLTNEVFKYTNLPKETFHYKRSKSNSLIEHSNSLTGWSISYGEDNGYLRLGDISLYAGKWDDIQALADSNADTTIVEAIATKQGKIKKITGGLCKNPNNFLYELFKVMHKKYVNNCDMAFSDALNELNYNIDSDFDIELNENLQKKLLASLKKNENKIITSDEKYYALIIGNNNYEHLEKLDAAENDAKVLANVLQDKYGFEVDLLLNADYDTTVNSLFKITNKLKSNDNLLIYYAGHGELDKAENRGYWLPVDASYELRSKWISNQRIVDRIKATKAKHVLLMVDSCFSGTLMRSGTTPEIKETIDEKYIERLKKKKTRLVITSGGEEPVVDSDGGEHSLFALKLIDTLKNNNTVINSQILFENIRRYVVSNADQTPERALVHKTGHDGGDFLFFAKN